jgi:hypothetical protein
MFFGVLVDVSDHFKSMANTNGKLDIDMITMFENAYKQQPTNEELGAQTFFANVRTGNWKTAQQVRHRIHRISTILD